MPKKNRMSRVGLSPAEEARAGTQSEAKRRKYKKGGDIAWGQGPKGPIDKPKPKPSRKPSNKLARHGIFRPPEEEWYLFNPKFDPYDSMEDRIREEMYDPPDYRRWNKTKTKRPSNKGNVRRVAKGGMVQGYDARKDEQLGMTRGPERNKDMSMAARRNVARATRKPRGTYGFNKGGGIGMGQALKGGGAVRRKT